MKYVVFFLLSLYITALCVHKCLSMDNSRQNPYVQKRDDNEGDEVLLGDTLRNDDDANFFQRLDELTDGSLFVPGCSKNDEECRSYQNADTLPSSDGDEELWENMGDVAHLRDTLPHQATQIEHNYRSDHRLQASQKPPPSRRIFLGMPIINRNRHMVKDEGTFTDSVENQGDGDTGIAAYNKGRESTEDKTIWISPDGHFLNDDPENKENLHDNSMNIGESNFAGLSSSNIKQPQQIRSAAAGRGVHFGLPTFVGKRSEPGHISSLKEEILRELFSDENGSNDVRTVERRGGKGVFMGLPTFHGKRAQTIRRGKGVFMGLPIFNGKRITGSSSSSPVNTRAAGKGVFMGLPIFNGK